MTIPSGTRLGRYEIRSKIGEGGMGEVYRARDEKLNRDVAIKVLPASFSQDADRLRRFEQEAQAAGTLNHPNILAVFDVGTHENAPYVVSELLEGETLRERLDGPSIPQRKAVDYATQIARGLAAAHARSIVHRDLKPENIFIANDGQVKILDFGLAKLIEPVGPAQILTDLPTRKLNTTPGTVMGTLGYMSPEQVDGKPVDYRSDIFSFGVVLYEMLAGRRAFPQRETLRETLHAIATEDPPALSELNPHVSPSLEKVVERCLEKKPEDRFQSTRDLAFALEALSVASTTSHPELSTTPNLDLSTSPAVAAPASLRLWKILAVAAMLAAVAFSVAAFIAGKRAGTTLPPSYQRLTFSRGTIWNARFAPDGQTVVYSARWNGQPLDVFAARVGKTESRSLKLDNSDVLAISASNEMAVLRNRQYLGWFISRGTLARMPVDGAAARDLLEDVQEADWSPDGTKLAVVRWVNGQNQLEYPVGQVLYKTAGYLSHPRISPKGDLVAFMDHHVRWDDRGWVAVVVDLTGKKTVLSGEWAGEQGLAWSPAGDEIWFTANKGGEAYALYAVTLSGRERLVLRMTSDLMQHDISRDGHVLITSFNDSTTIIGQPPGETKERGTLAYVPGSTTSSLRRPVWLDRSGNAQTINLPGGQYNDPRLSPDGSRVACLQGSSGSGDVWVYDFGRATFTRLTFTSTNATPVWSSDSRSIYYVSIDQAANKITIFRKPADGSREAEAVTTINSGAYLKAIERDGEAALCDSNIARMKGDITRVPLKQDGQTTPIINTQFNEFAAALSADGRWLAYQSNESGRPEVYVRDMEGSGGRWQISTAGGEEPRWSPDGRELYYRNNNLFMSVAVDKRSAFQAGTPKTLFNGVFDLRSNSGESYDVDPKGNRFFMIRLAEDDNSAAQIRIVLNWFDELRRLVPTN